MNRLQATSISEKVRKEVIQRDKCCIICGSRSFLQIAHYINRSQGGLGLKENLVLLCGLCHREADNGKNSLEVKAKVRQYLEKLYPNFTDEMRRYDKWRRE